MHDISCLEILELPALVSWCVESSVKVISSDIYQQLKLYAAFLQYVIMEIYEQRKVCNEAIMKASTLRKNRYFNKKNSAWRG
jgi:hypothetical protein